MHLNLTKMKKIAIMTIVAIAIVAIVLVVANSQLNQSPINPSGSNNGKTFTFSSKNVVQNGLTIQATPQAFNYGDPVEINLQLDTHGGALSFDLTQVATLQDNNGTTYSPIGWNGSSPGGHHVSGVLNFPALSGQASSLQLILKNVYEADWSFEWSLNK